MSTRPIPLLGDISLSYVQQIEHSLDGGFTGTRIAGLDGEVQQRSGRPSHRVRIAGLLVGDSAKDDLGKLQKATQNGDELTFSADITSALRRLSSATSKLKSKRASPTVSPIPWNW